MSEHSEPFGLKGKNQNQTWVLLYKSINQKYELLLCSQTVLKIYHEFDYILIMGRMQVSRYRIKET